MYKRNPLMLAKGFAPAAEVGRALNKSLSTIHRLVNEDRVVGSRDGKALYVDLASLAKHFREDGNVVLAEAAEKLRKTLVAEGGGEKAPASKRAG